MLQQRIDACDRPSIAAAELCLHDKLISVSENFRRQAARLALDELGIDILLSAGLEFDRLGNLVCQQQIQREPYRHVDLVIISS